MSLTDPVYDEDFAVREWQRLDVLSARFDRHFKMAYTRGVTAGNFSESNFRELVTDCVVETGVRTAEQYEITFNPTSPIYLNLIEELTRNYMGVVNNESAKKEVKRIIPQNLSLSDRRDRLDVFGLDARSAVRLERMRQQGASAHDLRATRIDLSVQRGNLIALTEVNRIINATLETLWLDNQRGISKARRKMVYGGEWYKETAEGAKVISTLRGIPNRANKTIVTRKDNRVCNYCEPLDGVLTRIGAMFNTVYGLFKYPPFHPRCRCFMIVRY
jgi:hypothetical protein